MHTSSGEKKEEEREKGTGSFSYPGCLQIRSFNLFAHISIFQYRCSFLQGATKGKAISRMPAEIPPLLKDTV